MVPAVIAHPTMVGFGTEGIFVAICEPVGEDVVISVHTFWLKPRENQNGKEKRKASEAMEQLTQVRQANLYCAGNRSWTSAEVDLDTLLCNHHHWAKISVRLDANIIVGQRFGNLKRYLTQAVMKWAFKPISLWIDELVASGTLVRGESGAVAK